MPPGMQPPLILKYNASSVPIIQLALSSDTLTESQLFDFGNQFIRAQIATIAGASIPYPYGGATRQVQIDLRPDALRAQGLTANDVNNAIGNQNLIVPAGTQKIGDTEYNVKLNASPLKLDEINDLPIRSRERRGNVTYIRDVAFVHDGHPPQTNIVRVDGRRAVLMTIQKTGVGLDAQHRQRDQGAPAARPRAAAGRRLGRADRRPVACSCGPPFRAWSPKRSSPLR